MKTPPLVLLAGAMICSGCALLAPQQRPRAGSPVSAPAPTTPTQVTPRSDPTRTDRPVPQSQDQLPLPAEATPSPADGPGLIDPRDSDAPRWKPLEAPRNDPPSANQGAPFIELGRPEPIPAASSQPAREAGRTPASPVSQSNGWRDEFTSTGGRGMQTMLVGDGAPRVMIVGSIYGNEPESVALLDELVRNRELLEQVTGTLLLVRTANPDGFIEHVRTNQRGVDLNRNFPSVRFTANPSHQTGPHPASEVETQAVMQLLRTFTPNRVVHVRSAVGSRPLVLVNETARMRMNGVPLSGQIDFGPYAGFIKAGSLEEYVSERLSAEMVTILLPPGGFESLSPKQLMGVALFGLADSNPASAATITGNESSQGPNVLSTAAPPPAARSDVGEWVRGERGYVELLPPPPDDAAADPSVVRYYELPPPE